MRGGQRDRSTFEQNQIKKKKNQEEATENAFDKSNVDIVYGDGFVFCRGQNNISQNQKMEIFSYLSRDPDIQRGQIDSAALRVEWNVKCKL